MKKFNRIIALLLALMLTFTFSVMTVSADEVDETETTDVESTDAAESTTEESAVINKALQPEAFEKSDTFTVPDSFTKVSENANLTLFLNYANGEYALYNKKNNEYLFSNPLDRENDKYVNGDLAKIAESLMAVSYVTADFKTFELNSTEAQIITEKYGDSQIVSFFFDSNTTGFIIPIMLTLKEDYLEVEVLFDSMNEMSDSRVLQVSLMQMFGAGNLKDEGYILLPDGIGSLMRFNQSRVQTLGANINVYDGYVFGRDPTTDAAVNEWNYGRDLTEGIRMPIYGIKKNDSAFLSIITKSAANVSYKAYCSGMISSYNYIYPTVNVRDSQTRRTAAGTTGAGVYYSDELPENFIMRVYPLAGDDADYVGMAETYRNYLINDLGMKPMDNEVGTPMNVTTIGAYKRIKHFLGFPYTGVDAMTTFSQTSDILKDLSQAGVDNMICNMIGWNEGGLEDSVSTKFNPESTLGGKKGAEQLLADAKELGVPMMFDVDLVKFHQSSGSYTKFNSTVYGLDLAPIAMFPFILSLNRVDKERTPYYLFHPTAMMSIATTFVNNISGNGITDYSFSTLGKDPYPAYNHDDVYTRDDTVATFNKILGDVAEKTDDLVSTSYGNTYVLPYANNIVEAPLYSSHLYFAREEVPFYHMALRGLVRISGPALNLSAETEDVILRSAQFGVGLYAVLSHESSSNLKDTSYNYYYSTEYALLGDDISAAYNRLNKVYDAIGTSTIVDFQVVSDDLKITTFANGAKVYVNYGETELTHNGVTIPASDFTVMGGDK